MLRIKRTCGIANTPHHLTFTSPTAHSTLMAKQRKIRKVKQQEIQRRTVDVRSSKDLRYSVAHVTPNGSQATSRTYVDPSPTSHTIRGHDHTKKLDYSHLEGNTATTAEAEED
ncbi:hypothetical protein PQX77_006209 [Marasmius sp. AFHP31]|nr:hypothetical protein PQX77_006209 [Marasmius sp. AFHP31]